MINRPLQLTPDKSLMLRGLAILAVLGIHLLGYVKGAYTSSNMWLFVSLDQLMRFCVPLFVIISGFGLAKSYGQRPLSLKDFYRRRAFKFLPPYLLWSLVSYALFMWIPPWRSYQPLGNLLSELLLGRVDYQLYFMVLIFQLYFLFPLLLGLVKRWPTVTLLLAFGVQLGLYLWYGGWLLPDTLPVAMMKDNNQYVFFASWIGYFVFGIWLSFKALPRWLIKFLPYIAVAAFLVAVGSAATAIQDRTDPLIALRTTRWPIMFFATSVILLMMTFKHSVTKASVPSTANKVLSWLGKKSYIIFLAHTIALRILFDALEQSRDYGTLAVAAIIWGVTVLVTQKYLIKE